MPMTNINELIAEMHDEADLCANEGADDIAAMLCRAAKALTLFRDALGDAKPFVENFDAYNSTLREGQIKAMARIQAALASCDTHPKGGGVQQAPSPMSGAVPKADAQNPSQNPLPRSI